MKGSTTCEIIPYRSFHANNSQGSIDLFPKILNRNGSMDLISIESFVKTSEETKS
jgi:hypothetical protein